MTENRPILKLPIKSKNIVLNQAKISEKEVKPEEIEKVIKTGVVRFYKVDKGYGFIKADDGSGETFVHLSRIQKAGLEKLVGGQKIRYLVKLDKQRNKNYASTLSLI